MLKNSPRNCSRNRSVMANDLNTEKSTFVRPGPRRIPLPAFPNVNWAGVTHGAPAVLSEVLNQCVIVGSEMCQSATRLGRLEDPVFATEFARTGANGSPVCDDRIMLICQSPNAVFCHLCSKWNRFPCPNGKSYSRV